MSRKTAGDALFESILADLKEHHRAHDARETELWERARAAALTRGARSGGMS
jgi:hypothetical protein